jgi:hypothetical protein
MYKPSITDLNEIQKREEQDDIFRFLASLDASYEQARSQILLFSESPSIDEVAAMIEREETRRVVMGAASDRKSRGQSLRRCTSYNS